MPRPVTVGNEDATEVSHGLLSRARARAPFMMFRGSVGSVEPADARLEVETSPSGSDGQYFSLEMASTAERALLRQGAGEPGCSWKARPTWSSTRRCRFANTCGAEGERHPQQGNTLSPLQQRSQKDAAAGSPTPVGQKAGGTHSREACSVGCLLKSEPSLRPSAASEGTETLEALLSFVTIV